MTEQTQSKLDDDSVTADSASRCPRDVIADAMLRISKTLIQLTLSWIHFCQVNTHKLA